MHPSPFSNLILKVLQRRSPDRFCIKQWSGSESHGKRCCSEGSNAAVHEMKIQRVLKHLALAWREESATSPEKNAARTEVWFPPKGSDWFEGLGPQGQAVGGCASL